ncbi:MAG: glycosyltransferase family 2 protein [Pseudomonadota bacterium]
MPSITAIIPTYNRAGYLKEALDALGRQTRPIDEIIVWDDGSTDGTIDVVRAWGKGVRYFRSENGGKSRALNAAMGQATGDCVWICDDDDLALPQAAETLSAMLEADPAIGVAGGGYRRFRDGPEGRVEQGPGYWPDLNVGSPIRHLLEDIFLFQNATLVRRSLYDRVGPFREDLARSIDYDMVVRLGLAAPMCLTETAVFLQRKHDGDRGPAAARHAASRSDDVWKAADRAVFAPFRRGIPLDFYGAFFETAEPDLARRAALLQRGCIAARRTDWAAAAADLEAAAAVLPEMSLSDVERGILRRMAGGKHGIDEALADDMPRRLIGLGQRGGAGAEIARGLARGLHWRVKAAVRDGRWRDGARISRLTARLSMVRGGGTGLVPPKLEERRALPAAAYSDVVPIG